MIPQTCSFTPAVVAHNPTTGHHSVSLKDSMRPLGTSGFLSKTSMAMVSSGTPHLENIFTHMEVMNIPAMELPQSSGMGITTIPYGLLTKAVEPSVTLEATTGTQKVDIPILTRTLG